MAMARSTSRSSTRCWSRFEGESKHRADSCSAGSAAGHSPDDSEHSFADALNSLAVAELGRSSARTDCEAEADDSGV
eukprot:755184-Hanusia_phi.AAC.4